MPQFDNGSFFNQVLFFFLFFGSCYFLTTYSFVPFICKSLKFRKKKANLLQTYLIGINLENWKQQSFLNTKIYNITNNFHNVLRDNHNQVLIKVVPVQREAFNRMLLKSPYLTFKTQFFAYPRYFQ